MKVFDYHDYKQFINDWVSSQPKKGHGQYRKMAIHLDVTSTVISQIFKGEKNLSLELAEEICEYLSLDTNEAEYFHLLVNRARAGSHKLRMRLDKQIEAMKAKNISLNERLLKDKTLNSETQIQYYSSWMYTGVRNLCAIRSFNNEEAIAKKLKLTAAQVRSILKFLLENGLCKLDKDNNLVVAHKVTHLPADSPLVTQHHRNWRLRAFDRMTEQNEDDLFFTSPMSLSWELASKVRSELPDFIASLNKRLRNSNSESAWCLNIDWFQY